MVTIVRAVVAPRSVVWMVTVTEHGPRAAPFGMVVVKTARPEPFVGIDLDTIAGTRLQVRVKTALAFASALPSGSVTMTASWTGSGSFETLIW